MFGVVRDLRLLKIAYFDTRANIDYMSLEKK
jgi:hypothetical protein